MVAETDSEAAEVLGAYIKCGDSGVFCMSLQMGMRRTPDQTIYHHASVIRTLGGIKQQKVAPNIFQLKLPVFLVAQTRGFLIYTSDNIQYNTVGRWVDGTIVLLSDDPMLILIDLE